MKYGTDYSKTAINLTQHMEVHNLLLEYGQAKALVNIKEAELAATAEYKALQKTNEEAFAALNKVKEAIDRAGSYQHGPEGLYALKQSRTSVSYSVDSVRKLLPKFAVAVIEETVNGVAIQGLIKGKLITQGEVAQIEVRKPLSPAYIIDIVKEGPSGKDSQASD